MSCRQSTAVMEQQQQQQLAALLPLFFTTAILGISLLAVVWRKFYRSQSRTKFGMFNNQDVTITTDKDDGSIVLMFPKGSLVTLVDITPRAADKEPEVDAEVEADAEVEPEAEADADTEADEQLGDAEEERNDQHFIDRSAAANEQPKQDREPESDDDMPELIPADQDVPKVADKGVGEPASTAVKTTCCGCKPRTAYWQLVLDSDDEAEARDTDPNHKHEEHCCRRHHEAAVVAAAATATADTAAADDKSSIDFCVL